MITLTIVLHLPFFQDLFEDMLLELISLILIKMLGILLTFHESGRKAHLFC